MSTKELLIQEISSMSETELIETLNIIQSIKNKQSTNLSQLYLPHRQGSGKSILRHAGKWVSDDLKECLEIVPLKN